MAQLFNFAKPIRRFILMAFWLVSMNSAGAQTLWKITGSSVVFTVKQFGSSIDGTLKGMTGTIRFDPANPQVSGMSATVDVRTINTNNSLRDRHLREREMFFNVEKYPSLRMKATRIEKVGSGYVGFFDLTIKDLIKPVRLPFTFETSGKNGTFVGTFDFNRRDWNVGGNTIGLSDRVTVRINVNTQLE
ncbi:MAG: YceI family protein [Cytophagaceae bacterium]|nr:YceI family protein [Cytophagaceae bacterium]